MGEGFRKYRVERIKPTALKIENGAQQLEAIEIGPERVGNVKLGVSNLPEEEIADAHFAGSADEQIGLG